MSIWRLLAPRIGHCYENMAVDEAILTARICGFVPNTLRLYRWSPPAVSVGRFQNVEKEVNLDNCNSQGIGVVRRITGGGTVYHDSEGEITYSVVARTQDLGTSDIGIVYSRLYVGLAEALEELGVTADFNVGTANACPNLTVKSRKISGSAQTYKSGVVLQHGTLLLNIDFERMFAVLRVPYARRRMEVINAAKSKMTSIEGELGRNVSIEDLTKALARGFSHALRIKLEEGTLVPYESNLVEKLLLEKYAKDEWNLLGES